MLNQFAPLFLFIRLSVHLNIAFARTQKQKKYLSNAIDNAL